MKAEFLESIERKAKEICEKNRVALYDISYKNTKKGKVLSVEITKIGGVSIDDCEIVSKEISRYLDDSDIIPTKYYLEVSSPGLERMLKQKKHYISAINEKIKVTYKNNDKVETITGTLLEVLPETIKVKGKESLYEILFKDIKKAKTIFEIKK